MLSSRRKRKANFGKLRRIYVNKHYELLKEKEAKNQLYLICQDTGLDGGEYLELKRKLEEKGGSLIKFMNKHSYFSNLSKLFGGGTLVVEWDVGKNFVEKKEFLEKNGCVVLCVLNENKFHYSSELIKLKEEVEKKKDKLIRCLKSRFNRIYKIKAKWYANLSSIKEKSKEKN
jgi:hypothetical protein